MNNQVEQLGEACKEIALNLSYLHEGGEQSFSVQLSDDVPSQEYLMLSVTSAVPEKTSVNIALSFMGQSFSIEAVVVECVQQEEGFRLTLSLQNAESQKTRMLLQLSEIQRYRKSESSKGRALTIDEAASEWIEKFAAQFAEGFES